MSILTTHDATVGHVLHNIPKVYLKMFRGICLYCMLNIAWYFCDFISLFARFIVLCFDLLTRPKMPFKVMHRKEVIHSNGSYVRKSCWRKLADEMGRAKKIPMVHYRVMHRKRVTYELHDSYFRLMTIKHSISKIEWASNDCIIQLSSTSQLNWVPASWVEDRTQLETRCGRESHARPRGASGTPMEFGDLRSCW